MRCHAGCEGLLTPRDLAVVHQRWQECLAVVAPLPHPLHRESALGQVQWRAYGRRRAYRRAHGRRRAYGLRRAYGRRRTLAQLVRRRNVARLHQLA